MTTGNSPPSTRWTWLAAGTLAAGIAACNSTPTSTTPADTGVDMTPADMVVVPDAPPDSPVQPDAAPDATPDATPDVLPDITTDTPPPDVPMPPGVSSRPIVDCGTICTRPLDAIPNSMGTVVFFTGFTAMGEAAVFRATIPAVGSPTATPTVVVAGMGLEFPVGITISNDDNTLYVADQSADRGMEAGIGSVFAIPVGGGAPSSIALTTDIVHPAAVSITADGNDLLVTGQRRTDMGQVRVLVRVPRAGGVAMILSTDLVDPSGVSQGPSGRIICHDTRRGGARSATAVTIGATNTDFASGLVANYPAGLAFAGDSTSALFSGADPGAGGGLLTWSDSAGHATAPPALSANMVTPLGLHRARMSDTWAVADEAAGGNGEIFLVTSR